ncbi:carbohydrate-binding module family 13 protein [Mucor lusitanicus]|uniref:Carbohydrate-binding module family 13 protein n=2 Tax=Mucor circinelloides f. lusitanicus TaxID=29924 RepID=A0A162Q474_MUCCL|nr:carbohydrate-binding module family 13 protein [Mucor lusitanicus]OAC98809.1 carbohydrate-binding module family 13 protein [Mucor lusitanicus CBS 277.49]
MSTSGWFYIRSTSTGNVVAASSNTEQDLLRSQVIVTPPTLSDHELWCWKGQFLCNKANDLVLDIRKGRLRLIEDTEICLYTPKPLEDAHNQLWSVREDAVDAYGRPLPGSYIYSLCSNEWVLDVQPTDQGVQKLVLFPLQPIDNDNQRWIFVKEGQLDLNVSIKDSLSMAAKSNINGSYFSMSESLITPPGSVSSSPDYPTTANEEYPQGLTPAKRGSHSAIFSMEAFKDYYNRVYATQEANISDKGIAMASAYRIFQDWKLDQISNDIMTGFPLSSSNEVRSRLQILTQNEVSKLLSNSDMYPNNSKENTSNLSSRLITQLYDQTPISP